MKREEQISFAASGFDRFGRVSHALQCGRNSGAICHANHIATQTRRAQAFAAFCELALYAQAQTLERTPQPAGLDAQRHFARNQGLQRYQGRDVAFGGLGNSEISNGPTTQQPQAPGAHRELPMSLTGSARAPSGRRRLSSCCGTTGAAGTTAPRRRSSTTSDLAYASRASSSRHTCGKACVSHTRYEFGSILKFIEQTFRLRSLHSTGERANQPCRRVRFHTEATCVRADPDASPAVVLSQTTSIGSASRQRLGGPACCAGSRNSPSDRYLDKSTGPHRPIPKDLPSSLMQWHDTHVTDLSRSGRNRSETGGSS